MKKDLKAWAVKLRGRSFLLNMDGTPLVYTTQKEAKNVAMGIQYWKSIKAEPIRVRVRIEEIT